MKAMPHRNETTDPGTISVRPRGDTTGEALLEVYHRLYARYGPQLWWPGESGLEMIVGAILAQGTAWTNVEKALANLKAAGLLTVEALWGISEYELASLLRPSGTFNAKARKLKAFINHLWDNYGGHLERLLAGETRQLREELLSIHGVGEETADAILLYAAGKPSFVIDTYTRRIVGRLGMAPDRESYRAYQALFHRNLPADAGLYNEYHALLDRHGKETCKKDPRCRGCCLLDLCPTGALSIDTCDHENL